MALNKTQVKELEEFLDYRYNIALDRDKELGNENGAEFIPSNPDFIYYKGCLAVVENLGYYWKRHPDGKHSIY